MARQHSIFRFLGATALAAFLLGVLSPQSFGQEQDEGASGVGTAERNFRLYCSNCHGESGRGDGPKTFGLSGPAPDLTGLSERNGGVFPRARLRAIIDGREVLKNHGDREMPVWGVWFKMEAEEDLGGAEGDEGTVQRRITGLIDYLETLQSP
jgi:mono/diheme cytochrome c family protein